MKIIRAVSAQVLETGTGEEWSPSPPVSPEESSQGSGVNFGSLTEEDLWSQSSPVVHPDMSTDDLIKKLRQVALLFQRKTQPLEGDDEHLKLTPFCLHLTGKGFLDHSSEDVRLLVACSIADIFRIFAPQAPFKDPIHIKSIFHFLISQLRGLQDIHRDARRYVHLLETLVTVKTFTVCFELEPEDAEGILIDLMTVIFSSVSNDHHSDNVKATMLALLAPLICEAPALSFQILDTILVRLLRNTERVVPPASYQLAKELILKCSDSLEAPINTFLTAVLVAKPDDFRTLQVAINVYDVIFALYEIRPEIVETSLLQLDHKLLSLLHKDRTGAVGLLGKIFSARDSSTFRSSHPNLWQQFLGRFNDAHLAVRRSCVQYSTHLLRTHPEIRPEIERVLIGRLHDPEDSIRLEVVKSILATAIAGASEFEYVVKSLGLMTCLKERCRDKKIQVRVKALEGLAQVYRTQLDRRWSGGPEGWISSRILEGYLLEGSGYIEDRILIERLLNTCLVPHYLDARGRMAQLLYLVSTSSVSAYKAFIDTQNHLIRARRHLSDLVNCVRNPLPDPEDQVKLLKTRVTGLAKFVRNPVVGSEYLNYLIRSMETETSVLEAVEVIGEPSSDCQAVGESIKTVLLQMGPCVSLNLKYVTVKTLLDRTASRLIDKEAVLALLEMVSDLVTSGTFPDNQEGYPAAPVLIEKACKLISDLASIFPPLFTSSKALELLKNLLLSKNLDPDSSSEILSALVTIGKQCGPLGQVIVESLTGHLLNLVDFGSPRQAKMAVRCLHANLRDDPSKREIFAKILQTIRKNLEPPSLLRYRTAIVALGHVALLMPSEFKAPLKTLVTRNVIKGLLIHPPRSAQDSQKCLGSWCEEKQLPEVTRCMISGLKTVVRWLIGLQNDVTSAKNAFRMLTAFATTGGIEDKETPFPFSDPEKAWLRLGAAKNFLKLVEMKGVGDQFTAAQFCALAQVMNDIVAQVRARFAARLNKGLSKGLSADKCLPLDFLGYYALGAFETDGGQQVRLKGYMAKAVECRQNYVKMLTEHPAQERALAQLPHLMPGYMLAFAVPILANNPRSLELDEILEGLQFVLEPLVKDGSFSFRFYSKLLQGIKNSRNAADPGNEDGDLRMYRVCDVALQLIMPYGSWSVGEEGAGGLEPRIPRLYFQKREEEEATWNNLKGYLSPEFLLKIAERRGRHHRACGQEKKEQIASKVAEKGEKKGKRSFEENFRLDEKGMPTINAGPTDPKRTKLVEVGTEDEEK